MGFESITNPNPTRNRFSMRMRSVACSGLEFWLVLHTGRMPVPCQCTGFESPLRPFGKPGAIEDPRSGQGRTHQSQGEKNVLEGTPVAVLSLCIATMAAMTHFDDSPRWPPFLTEELQLLHGGGRSPSGGFLFPVVASCESLSAGFSVSMETTWGSPSAGLSTFAAGAPPERLNAR